MRRKFHFKIDLKISLRRDTDSMDNLANDFLPFLIASVLSFWSCVLFLLLVCLQVCPLYCFAASLFSSFFRLLMRVTLLGDVRTLVYCDYFRVTRYSFVPLSFKFGIIMGLRHNVRTVQHTSAGRFYFSVRSWGSLRLRMDRLGRR